MAELFFKEADQCPRCGDITWYEKEGYDILWRCMCGMTKIVCTKKGDAIIQYVVPRREVRLPPKGTKLMTCLGVTASWFPDEVTTAQLARATNHTTSDVASTMTVLMHKGLIERVKEGRGIAGGSSWKITKRAQGLLRMRR